MNAEAKIANNFVFADGRCLVVVMLLCLVKNFSLFAGCVLGLSTARKVFGVSGGFERCFICLTNSGCSPELAARSLLQKG